MITFGIVFCAILVVLTGVLCAENARQKRIVREDKERCMQVGNKFEYFGSNGLGDPFYHDTHLITITGIKYEWIKYTETITSPSNIDQKPVEYTHSCFTDDLYENLKRKKAKLIYCISDNNEETK
jgi:hypothetical protein